MSDLLNKFKTSPTPRPQITIYEYKSIKKQTQLIFCSKLKDKVKTLALYAFGAAAVIFTAYNMYAYNKSFDNCVQILKQIEVSSVILEQEINSLRQQFGEVDYE